MKTMLTLIVACAAVWCLGGQPADAAQAELSPVTVTGSLGCDVDTLLGTACVDVYEIHCTQSTRRIQVALDDTDCDDNFIVTLVGWNPTRLLGIGKADATKPDSCGAATGEASAFIDIPGAQGSMRAVLSVSALTGTNRNYSINIQCLADPIGSPVFRNVIVTQTTGQ